MSAVVLPTIQERRAVFTIDVYSGDRWLREGSGEYQYWTHLPELKNWCPVQMQPPFYTQCLFCLVGGQNAGLHIGQTAQGQLENATWQIRLPNSFVWTTVLSKQIGGWLLLPPNET
ncbi:hypothetical protein C7271_24780 [filamentous cyanobacterium CCP5]|nr:hypothetical protein C7271_24780 [filamentous cyanobacterium CCP5]